jgi:hypothetical protein
MKRLLLNFLLVVPLIGVPALWADDATLLAGKWSVKKKIGPAEGASQTIEVKKDKFTFEILDGDGHVFLHAEGDLKLEKLVPFSFVKFTHIRGGDSADNLQDVDDEFGCIYMLDGDTWTVASNFDKQRDQPPSLDVYHRVAAKPETKTLVIDEIEMADTPQSATWFLCFEVTVGGVNRRHYVENKGYDKNQVKIPLTLELPGVKAGQKCSFKMQLDDVDGDACGDDVDNRSTGDFSLTERGAQTYKPEDNWRYTIRWHLK